MQEKNEIRTGRHCVFKLHCHLVFVTKYRKAVFTASMMKSLEGYFSKVCTNFEVHLEEFNGERDHVHLLVNYPPKVSISTLVNSLKGVSSRLLRQEFSQEIDKIYWKGVLWSPSYFAGSVGGAPISVLREYIEQQESPAYPSPP
jgi:putative transposase